jgi:phospholipid/cholesterol/gamma-HCH transport system substrate-binding protein
MKRRDEVTVGILLTVAVIVLVVGTLWLVRGGLRSGYPLFVRFPWGQNLKQGQPVMLAGVTVGYVSDVQLNPIGVLDVDLRIQDKYKVPRTAVAEVYPVGIFGDVAIALKIPTGPSAESFAPGDTLPARAATSGLDALQSRADTISATLDRITRAMESELVQTGGLRDIRQSIAATNRLVAQFQAIAAEQNRNFTATLASFRSAANAVDSAQIARSLGSLRSTSAHIDTLTMQLGSNSTQLQAILARIERGEGTAGKFLTDTLLYRDARNLLTRVDSLVADFQRNPRKYINLRVF